MEKKTKDIIPDKIDMELKNLLKNKTHSLAIFETLMMIENHDDIDPKILRELIISSDDRVEEIIKSNKETRINLNYPMYSIQITPYYLKKIFHYFKRMGWVKVDTLINRRDEEGVLTAINQRNIFINYINLYYYLHPFKYYLYKFLKFKEMIYESKKLEGDLQQILHMLNSNIPVEDAIRSLHSDNPKVSHLDEKPEVKETNSKVIDTPKEEEPKKSTSKEKNPNAPTGIILKSQIIENDEDDEDDELEFSEGVAR